MIKLLGAPAWRSCGPNPIALGNTAITGAIQCAAAQKISRPGDPEAHVIYLGAVNGGVWRSDSFTASMLQGSSRTPAIQWKPLTDSAPTLSVSSMALDPHDATGNTLWVGTGRVSSFNSIGGPVVGLLKTTNARDPSPAWMILGDQTPQPTDVSLAGQRIFSVIPTTLQDPGTGKQIILVAADRDGILRSRDGGLSFQRVAGPTGSLSGYGTDLIADPNEPQIFYAALSATYDDRRNLTSSGGVFRSVDGGLRWTMIDSGIPQARRSKSLKLTVFNNAGSSVPNAGPTVLYAGEADTSGNTNNLIGIFRCADPHAARPIWTALFSDSDPTHIPNGLGAEQWPAAALLPWFGMAVDPKDWNNIYLGGMTWLYRVQASGSNSVTTMWTPWGAGGGWDFRSLMFLTSDILLNTGDPGIFGLYDPANSTQWISLNNSVAVTELYAVAYDPTTGLICGGTQDVGSPVQNICGGWNQLPDGGGDGGLALVASDGVYYYEVNGRFRRTQASWHADEDLKGVLTTAPAACTWGPCRLDIFYRGQNNHLWHRWFDGGWHAEEDLGGVLSEAPGACTWGPGRVDIFYRGQNNHLWHRWFEGNWQTEEDLGGVLTSAPAACTWGPGRVDIFYRGQNNHLWHRWFEEGWQAEEDLGGVLTSAPAACTWGHGRIDIFYRGQNNHLWHRWFDGGWHAEEDLGGVLTSAPAACTWGPGRVDIFYRGQNNHLWHRWFEGSWQPEEDLGGTLTDMPGACTWGPGRIDILNRGENQHLWHKWFERSGGQVMPAGVPTVTGTRGAVVNPVNPRQLLVAHGNQLLESSDRADSVRDITPQAMRGAVTALAYGTDNSSVAYVGTTSGELFLRTAGNGVPLPVANYPGNGAEVDDIAVDRAIPRSAAIPTYSHRRFSLLHARLRRCPFPRRMSYCRHSAEGPRPRA
jgi:hypothetical protein